MAGGRGRFFLVGYSVGGFRSKGNPLGVWGSLHLETILGVKTRRAILDVSKENGAQTSSRLPMINAYVDLSLEADLLWMGEIQSHHRSHERKAPRAFGCVA